MIERCVRRCWEVAVAAAALVVCVAQVGAQEVQLSHGSTVGQGLLREHQGQCYVITAAHVVADALDSISVIGATGFKTKGTLLRSFAGDIGVVLLRDARLGCKPWEAEPRIAEALQGVSTGHLSIRESDGSLVLLPVTIMSVTSDLVVVRPQQANDATRQGMSGGVLIVNRQPIGFLRDIASGVATVVQYDDVLRVTQELFTRVDAAPRVSTYDRPSLQTLKNQANDSSYWVSRCTYQGCQLLGEVGLWQIVRSIRYGENEAALDQIIRFDSVPTEGVGGGLTQYSRSPYSSWVNVRAGTTQLFVQLEWIDGTRSRTRRLPIEVPRWEKAPGALVSPDKSRPQTSTPAPTVFLHPLMKALHINTPIPASSLEVSVDEDRFRAARHSQGQQLKGVVAFDFYDNALADDVPLVVRFRSADSTLHGPFHYRVPGVSAQLAYGMGTLREWLPDLVRCIRVREVFPVPPVTAGGNGTEEEYQARVNAAWNMRNNERIQWLSETPALGCSAHPNPTSSTRIDSYSLWDLVSRVHLGPTATKLGTVVQLTKGKNVPTTGVRWVAKIPLEQEEVYLQVEFYDGSKSQVINVPIERPRR